MRRAEPRAAAASDRPATQVVALRRSHVPPSLEQLTRRIRKTAADPRFELKDLGGNQIQVSGPESKLANAWAALHIRDALDGFSFADEPGLFRSGEASSRTVSFHVSAMGVKELVHCLAAAAAWPLVMDPGIKGTVTLALDNVRWDEAVRTVLELGHLTATRYGGVWFVSSEARLREIAARELPLVYFHRPERTTVDAAAAALEPAKSSTGVIAANHRLGIVVIADQADRFPAYGRILKTIECRRHVPRGRIRAKGLLVDRPRVRART
jgi:hypothetical protein